jgi:quercetin dioxygenase-like cupin family protein
MAHARRLLSAVMLLLGMTLASPVHAQQATPGAGAGSTRLLTAMIPAGPDLANATLYFSRLPYEAGQGDEAMTFVGPTIFAAHTGTLTACADGPVGLALHDAPASRDGAHPELAAGTEQPLQPGDAIVVPAGVPISLHNPGPEAADGFAIGILLDTEGEGQGLGDTEGSGGVSEPWPLLGKGVVETVTTPVTVTVEQVVLAPGTTLDQPAVSGAALVHVETGTVMAAVEEGVAEASSGPFLRTGAVGPGAVFLEAGQERRLRDGAGLFVHAGSTYSLRNEDDQPAHLLILRLTPDGAATEMATSGTPAP